MPLVIDKVVSEGLVSLQSLHKGTTQTTVSNSTQTLVLASTTAQVYSGSVAGQIVALPDATTLLVGYEYSFRNDSSVAVTLKNSALTTLATILAGQRVIANCSSVATAAGAWSLSIFTNIANQDIVEITVDPSVTAVTADAGAILINKTLARAWVKMDSGSTVNVKPINPADIGASTQGYSGWTSTANVVLSNTSTTNVRVAISAATKIMYQGKEVNLPIANYDVTISGAAGVKYVYFVNSTLTVGTVFATFFTACPVAIVTWDGAAITNLSYELHSADRNLPDHYWKHLTEGMKYASGLAITTNVQTDNATDPNVDTVQYFWLTSGQTLDEDIQVNVGTAPWNTVALGSGLTSSTAASLPIYFYNGTGIVRAAPMTDRTPFISTATAPFYNATGTPHYELNGILTPSVTNDYVVYWVYASSLLGADTCFTRPHTAVYTSLNAALTASDASLNWTNFSSAEAKLLYRLIFRVNTGWGAAPAHLCKLVSVFDYRKTASSPVGGSNASDHASLVNRDIAAQHPATSITNTPAGNVAATEVQAAINELDTEKAGIALANTFSLAQTFSAVPIFSLGTNEVAPVNYIINSQMIFSQRGDFTANAAAANATYYTDRFYVNLVTCTANRIVVSSAGGGNEYNANCLTLEATNTATGTFAIGQAVETPFHLIGKVVTFSAWVRSNDANTRLRLVHGTGGVLNAQSTAHTGGGGWERLSMTVTVPTNVTATDHLYCKVAIYNAGNVSVATGKYIQTNCWMLQEGQLTPYQPFGNYSEELLACQRYRESNFPIGVTPANGSYLLTVYGCVALSYTGYVYIPYLTPKRIAAAVGNVTFYCTNAGANGTWLFYTLTSAFLEIAPTFISVYSHEASFAINIVHTTLYPTLALGGWMVDVEITPA